jgi:hypothetical protein
VQSKKKGPGSDYSHVFEVDIGKKVDVLGTATGGGLVWHSDIACSEPGTLSAVVLLGGMTNVPRTSAAVPCYVMVIPTK